MSSRQEALDLGAGGGTLIVWGRLRFSGFEGLKEPVLPPEMLFSILLSIAIARSEVGLSVILPPHSLPAYNAISIVAI
jgi:hypothetical protein